MVQASQLKGIGAKKTSEGQTIRFSRTHYMLEQVKKEKGEFRRSAKQQMQRTVGRGVYMCINLHSPGQWVRCWDWSDSEDSATNAPVDRQCEGAPATPSLYSSSPFSSLLNVVSFAEPGGTSVVLVQKGISLANYNVTTLLAAPTRNCHLVSRDWKWTWKGNILQSFFLWLNEDVFE